MDIAVIFVVGGLIAIICSAFTRIPLWIGCMLLGIGVVLYVYGR